MSTIEQIAYFQHRRDEAPNQELAKKLAQSRDKAGIREIADHLWDRNANVQSDCVKVLYEIGYIAPELIADYVTDFIKMIQNKNNRLVWGGMIALSTVAFIRPDECIEHLDELMNVFEAGSVITQDAGITTLAGIASAGESYSGIIFPIILAHLETCAAKYLALRAEHVLPAVKPFNQAGFVAVLVKRLPELPNPVAKRVRKLIDLYR